ncbi:MAG: glycerol-3-phosphate acyltransferase [Oscillospiraceae bacterium]
MSLIYEATTLTKILFILITAVSAYFLGCFNGAVIVSKYILRDDIRTHGSGNAGLTNFYRVFGGPLTLVVILTDVLKAVIATLIGSFLATRIGFTADQGVIFAGVFCMLGHVFPCMFGFKGGKGILSGGTIAFMLDWRVAVIAWGGFIILSVLTKWVSLGSIAAAILFPIAAAVILHDPIVTVLSIICGLLILWKHSENMKRILRGEESKFSFHKKKEDQ